jgi:hypothetical protein
LTKVDATVLAQAEIILGVGEAWEAFNALYHSGDVRAVAFSGTGDIYIGGVFTKVGNTLVLNIAKYSGGSWSALGSGCNNTVKAIAISGTDVYVGGEFTSAGGIANTTRIAKWNGSVWSAIGTGLNNIVNAIAVSGTGDVYVGGQFTTAGAVSGASKIAKWNGSAWSALSTGCDNTVNAIAISGTDIYVGGAFYSAGGIANTNRIAKWDGSAWSALGNVLGYGCITTVYALAIDSAGNVYVGGDLTSAGNIAGTAKIAKWNVATATWSALSGDCNNNVYALATSGTDVYVGGQFTSAGGVANTARIAKWNGSAWSALSTGCDNTVTALAVFGSDVYAGGTFTTAGVATCLGLAKYSSSTWSSIGHALNSTASILAIAFTSTGDLYVGGSFALAGNVLAANIAKYSGGAWSALTSGCSGGLAPTVYALSVSGTDDLYVGGSFTLAGSVPASRIAKWNGSAWSALTTGCSGGYATMVRAICISGTDVYIGGEFNNVGGVANTAYIAKWNGSAWSALSTGCNGTVYALAISGTDVYAGGTFNIAGGVSVAYVAKWNGSSWSALGLGCNGYVFALAINAGDVYVGGQFSSAGGIADTYKIAKWDGASWSALSSGCNSTVFALAISGTDVYVGGEFTGAIGVANTYRIAKWDGVFWSALDVGCSGPFVPSVRAVALNSTYVYVGGDFSSAGGLLATSLARYGTPPDVTAPTSGAGGVITTSNIVETSVDLSWGKATDLVTPQASLQYLVYYSLSAIMDSVTDVEANGIAVDSWATDIDSKQVAGLSSATTYYFNVLVRDVAGNKAAYIKKQQATATSTPGLGYQVINNSVWTTISGTKHFLWEKLAVATSTGTALNRNTLPDQTTPLAGLTDLADGEGLVITHTWNPGSAQNATVTKVSLPLSFILEQNQFLWVQNRGGYLQFTGEV